MNTTEMNITDEELREMLLKYKKQLEKNKKHNERWRMNNKDKVREYSKRYRQKQKRMIQLCKERNITVE
jgi:hypothetical protein